MFVCMDGLVALSPLSVLFFMSSKFIDATN